MDQIELEFLPSSEDFTHRSEFYRDLDGIDKKLRRKASSVTAYMGGGAGHGNYTGTFLVTIAPGVIAALSAVLGAWLQARYGRKVRLRIGDIEAEGRNLEEVDALLKRAADFLKKENKLD